MESAIAPFVAISSFLVRHLVLVLFVLHDLMGRLLVRIDGNYSIGVLVKELVVIEVFEELLLLFFDPIEVCKAIVIVAPETILVQVPIEEVEVIEVTAF